MGIGYAPDSLDDLLRFAQSAGLSLELMNEMGLLKRNEKGRYYDGYRGRAVIPIRDRFRRIIGFTARDMTGQEGVPKYMNPTDNEIYHKRQSIFASTRAVRQAAKEGKFLPRGGRTRRHAAATHPGEQRRGPRWARPGPPSTWEQLKRYAPPRLLPARCRPAQPGE